MSQPPQTLNRILATYRGLNPLLRFKHNFIFPSLFGHTLLSDTLDYVLETPSPLSSGKFYFNSLF